MGPAPPTQGAATIEEGVEKKEQAMGLAGAQLVEKADGASNTEFEVL